MFLLVQEHRGCLGLPGLCCRECILEAGAIANTVIHTEIFRLGTSGFELGEVGQDGLGFGRSELRAYRFVGIEPRVDLWPGLRGLLSAGWTMIHR